MAAMHSMPPPHATPRLEPHKHSPTHRLRCHAFACDSSLTEGIYANRTLLYPYTERLSQLLAEKGLDCALTNRGLRGDLATSGMAGRLAAALEQAQDAGQRYDWVVLLVCGAWWLMRAACSIPTHL